MSYKRLDILQAVETQLKTITTGNGYESGVGSRVSRRFDHYSEIKEFPAIRVVSGGGRIERAGYSGNDETVYKTAPSFVVVGYVKVNKDVDGEGLLSDAIENLIGDIIVCLYATPHLSLSYLRRVDPVRVEAYADWQAHIGIIEVYYEYEYEFMGGTP